LGDAFKEYYTKAKTINTQEYINSAKSSINSFSSILEREDRNITKRLILKKPNRKDRRRKRNKNSQPRISLVMPLSIKENSNRKGHILRDRNNRKGTN